MPEKTATSTPAPSEKRKSAAEPTGETLKPPKETPETGFELNEKEMEQVSGGIKTKHETAKTTISNLRV